jgi:FAD/FMN-containing dehydrogenase
MSTTASPELELPETFRGELLHPGDGGFNASRRMFNSMWERRPKAIARCRGVADVIDAVGLARSRSLPLSVYGGGHGVTGRAVADDGLVVDLRAMHGIHVDPGARIARVQGGVTWGDLDRETQLHGLAVTGGRVSTTGVAGLTLGGGSGWLERKLGYSVDNLLACEVVTADGRVLRASEQEHPELFWGLRGGGGNFGVVTSFEFALHPVGPIVLGGMLLFPGFRGDEVLRAFGALMHDAADELGAGVAFITAPPEDFVPVEARGQLACGVIVCWSGDPAEGEEAIQPLRDLAPAVDLVQPMPYTAVQGMIDAGNQAGLRNYWRGEFLAGLPPEAVDALVAAAAAKPSPNTQLIVVPGGGAIARVPEDATATIERAAPWNIHILSMWPEAAGDAENIGWTREASSALEPWKTGRGLLNFSSDEGESVVRGAVGADTFARLRALKDEYDPTGMFQANQIVTPTTR